MAARPEQSSLASKKLGPGVDLQRRKSGRGGSTGESWVFDFLGRASGPWRGPLCNLIVAGSMWSRSGDGDEGAGIDALDDPTYIRSDQAGLSHPRCRPPSAHRNIPSLSVGLSAPAPARSTDARPRSSDGVHPSSAETYFYQSPVRVQPSGPSLLLSLAFFPDSSFAPQISSGSSGVLSRRPRPSSYVLLQISRPLLLTYCLRNATDPA